MSEGSYSNVPDGEEGSTLPLPGEANELSCSKCKFSALRDTLISSWTTDDGQIVKQPSNQALLAFACISFLTFAIAEIFGAFASNSLSLLGDASTMIVDAMTYGLNMFAEYKKPKVSKKDAVRLELFAPLFSLVILFGISLYVISDAIQTLTGTADEEVNDSVMLVFASINLVFDILNMMCFYRAQRLFGFPTNESEHGDTETNTNMCSAYTHVLADTFRSIAVMVAALVSQMNDSVKSENADAWAAIFVSLIIFASTVPLIKGLVEKHEKLRTISLEETNTDDESSRTTSLLNEA